MSYSKYTIIPTMSNRRFPAWTCNHDVITASKTLGKLKVKCEGCRSPKKWPWVTMMKCVLCKKLWHRECRLPARNAVPRPAADTVAQRGDRLDLYPAVTRSKAKQPQPVEDVIGPTAVEPRCCAHCRLRTNVSMSLLRDGKWRCAPAVVDPRQTQVSEHNGPSKFNGIRRHVNVDEDKVQSISSTFNQTSSTDGVSQARLYRLNHPLRVIEPRGLFVHSILYVAKIGILLLGNVVTDYFMGLFNKLLNK